MKINTNFQAHLFAPNTSTISEFRKTLPPSSSTTERKPCACLPNFVCPCGSSVCRFAPWATSAPSPRQKTHGTASSSTAHKSARISCQSALARSNPSAKPSNDPLHARHEDRHLHDQALFYQCATDLQPAHRQVGDSSVTLAELFHGMTKEQALE